MRKRLQTLRPRLAFLSKLVPAITVVTIGIFGFAAGRLWVGPAKGQTKLLPLRTEQAASQSDYDKRVVAYVYDSIPITREELGEFLIARFGAERLDMLVTRRIVEMACRSHGIDITDADIERQLDLDLQAMSPGGKMTRKDFATQVLRRFNKTLYEYKEDVVRPKLMLAGLIGPTIKVGADDVKQAFDARYGPRVECRMIVLQDSNQKFQIWEKVRDSEAEFSRVAKTLNHPQLAAIDGRVPPIHRHFGDSRIEEAAFKLKPGEVSPLIGMPDGTVLILKCDRHLAADYTKRLEDERLSLMKEIESQKLAQRVQEELANLRRTANPKLLLRNETRQDDLERAVLPEIRGQAPTSQRIDVPPVPKVGG